MKRQHENLITNGIHQNDTRRPLSFNDQNSPSVIGRPENIRNIVSLWGRIKAAWLVFTTNAYAVRWYNEENAHTWTPDYRETHTQVLKHSDYIRSRMTGAKEANPEKHASHIGIGVQNIAEHRPTVDVTRHGTA